MNEWTVAALALLAGLVPCGAVCLRGSPVDRLVGLEMAGTVDTLVLLVLAEAYDQAIYFDLARGPGPALVRRRRWCSPASWSAGCEPRGWP